MKQTTLTGFEKYANTTRRVQFLAEMDKIISWPELAAAVQAAYPKVNENSGRPLIPLERMLRVNLLQLCFNLSDPALVVSSRQHTILRKVVFPPLRASSYSSHWAPARSRGNMTTRMPRIGVSSTGRDPSSTSCSMS